MSEDMMTQQELAGELASRMGISVAKAAETLRQLTAIFHEQLASRRGVRLNDLGTFRYQERAARTGRNPKTGEAILIPARETVRFKPAKALQV